MPPFIRYARHDAIDIVSSSFFASRCLFSPLSSDYAAPPLFCLLARRHAMPRHTIPAFCVFDAAYARAGALPRGSAADARGVNATR